MVMENRYDKYKDSGIAWIGEIPEHWEIRKLKNIFLLSTGTTPKEYDKISEGDNLINWYTPSDILEGCNDLFSSLRKLSERVIYENKISLFPIGTLLYVGIGASAGKVGYANENGYSNQQITGLIPLECYSRFYFYYLSVLKDKIRDNAFFTTLPIINNVYLGQELLPYPLLSEQQSIANYLDQKCGEIDELITLQEEMITKLQSYMQSVITEAVTKGLDKNVPLKDSGIEWIGEIPEHWEVKRLKYFGNNYNGLTYSPNDICNSQEGTIVLRSSNIKDNKLCFDDNVYVNKDIPTKLFVNKGDILICSRNGSASLIGKAALIETDIKATFGAFMMIFKGNNIHHKYLYYIVTSCISQYKWLFTTATINQLTSSMLGEIFAPFICDRLEQQSIADYLDQKCSEIDKIISIKQQKIEKLKDYKKSLIFECVTGKRKV